MGCIKILKDLWRYITMSNNIDILTARYKLVEIIGDKIQYKELIPTCIFNATMDYLNNRV